MQRFSCKLSHRLCNITNRLSPFLSTSLLTVKIRHFHHCPTYLLQSISTSSVSVAETEILSANQREEELSVDQTELEEISPFPSSFSIYHFNSRMEMNGYQRLQTPLYNKGNEFTEEERDTFALRGLLPPRILDEETQLERAMEQLRKKISPLEKYIYMQSMQDSNEALYYRMLIRYTSELMPIVYTPTVGQGCLEYSHIYNHKPRGLYISINDAGKIEQILQNWPYKEIKVIVFTDGERILGLGDLGINGMGIPIGKLSLYTACAGIHPQACLPVTIDVGTNNPEYLNDPFYMGLKQERLRDEKYDALVEEFMAAAKKMYGSNVLLQFEDFGNMNAFRLLEKTRHSHCTFNDDIQGTASVAVAGIISAKKLCGLGLAEHRYLFAGAGEAGTGIGDLIAQGIAQETGKSIEECRKQIWYLDSKGLVTKNRLAELQHHKLNYAHEFTVECKTLTEAIDVIKPTALIGVSTISKYFNKEICEKMAQLNKHPVIFALSNPTVKAECTAEEAYNFTNGQCVFASGSPFPELQYNGKTFRPGQGNNSYIFPGLGLGVLCAGMQTIPDEAMLVASRTLADQTDAEDYNVGCVYPPLSKIRHVSFKIAVAIVKYAYASGLATLPQPDDVEKFVASQIYHPSPKSRL